MQDLLIKNPLEGGIEIQFPGIICAAQLPNGSHVIARMIMDGSFPPKVSQTAARGGTQPVYFKKL
jgi:hypothetical protein